MKIDWSRYQPGSYHDEIVVGEGGVRPAARGLADYLASLDARQLRERQQAAERAIAEMGVSFTVYSEGQNLDRAWPFDIIPRVIAAAEWQRIAAGLGQRLRALNCFIADVYADQRLLRDGIMPAELVLSAGNYLPACAGARPPLDVWAHICGTDLVRDADGTVYVLEDNLRVPSGVAYMLENRIVTKQVFPELFARQPIQSVDDYPSALFDMLTSLVPDTDQAPEVVVLTPGIYNSAYFEHAWLAQRMGVELVEGADLVVVDDCVYMRTIGGLTRVDVIYTRVNAEYLDPEVLNPDSLLGVRGLVRAWRAGNVALANAPGTGVADDKVIYAYVPAMIRYYLAEEPILPNVPTWLCAQPDHLSHVLANLEQLVIKPANESGGYGMLIGPKASRRECAEFRELLRARPRNYVAQPVISLSTVPTVTGRTVEPRHVDLRPFILQGRDLYVTPGGLTRVALRRGSLIVNSSQGGGSKDTWVVG